MLRKKPEDVIRGTNNTMAKEKIQTFVDKHFALHRKLKIEQHRPH